MRTGTEREREIKRVAFYLFIFREERGESKRKESMKGAKEGSESGKRRRGKGDVFETVLWT